MHKLLKAVYSVAKNRRPLVAQLSTEAHSTQAGIVTRQPSKRLLFGNVLRISESRSRIAITTKQSEIHEKRQVEDQGVQAELEPHPRGGTVPHCRSTHNRAQTSNKRREQRREKDHRNQRPPRGPQSSWFAAREAEGRFRSRMVAGSAPIVNSAAGKMAKAAMISEIAAARGPWWRLRK